MIRDSPKSIVTFSRNEMPRDEKFHNAKPGE